MLCLRHSTDIEKLIQKVNHQRMTLIRHSRSSGMTRDRQNIYDFALCIVVDRGVHPPIRPRSKVSPCHFHCSLPRFPLISRPFPLLSLPCLSFKGRHPLIPSPPASVSMVRGFLPRNCFSNLGVCRWNLMLFWAKYRVSQKVSRKF